MNPFVETFTAFFDLILDIFGIQAQIWVLVGGVAATFFAVFIMYTVWRLLISRASGGFDSSSSDAARSFFHRGD